MKKRKINILIKDFEMFSMKSNEAIDEFFNRLKRASNELQVGYNFISYKIYTYTVSLFIKIKGKEGLGIIDLSRKKYRRLHDLEDVRVEGRDFSLQPPSSLLDP